jgi:hypothetical protein
MTYSVYNVKIDNELSFPAGPTAGYVLSINEDGSTSWVEPQGGGGGIIMDSFISSGLVKLNKNGEINSDFVLPDLEEGSVVVKKQLDDKYILSSGLDRRAQVIIKDTLSDKLYVATDADFYRGKLLRDTTARQVGATFRILRINKDGSLDESFVSPNFLLGEITTMDIDSNGRIYVGGNFTSPTSRICRLLPNGTRDTSFDVGTGTNGPILVLKVIEYNDGSNDNVVLLVGGGFSTYKGQTTNRFFITLPNSGNRNTDLIFNFNQNVATLEIKETEDFEYDIYIGGLFTLLNGVEYNKLVKIKLNLLTNSYNTDDVDFNIGSGFSVPGNRPTKIKLFNNKIYISGNFLLYNETSVKHFLRLNLDGSLDNTFINDKFEFSVNGFDIDDDGKIYVGGDFWSYGIEPFYYIMGLNNDGTINTDFNVGTGLRLFSNKNSSYANVLLHDNCVYYIGLFEGYNIEGYNPVY